jgi:DNA-binding winged helix-turn-helix (wHTH) protein
MLLERPGQLVTREEICQKLWSTDTFVDFDHSLGTAINKIREVLNDSAAKARFVETIPRRGYRFIASVTAVGGTDEDLAIPPDNCPEFVLQCTKLDTAPHRLSLWKNNCRKPLSKNRNFANNAGFRDSWCNCLFSPTIDCNGI